MENNDKYYVCAFSKSNDVKGQLISKCLFGILNASKKQTKKFDLTTMVTQVELFSFVSRKNWRHQRHFEIKWSLAMQQTL